MAKQWLVPVFSLGNLPFSTKMQHFLKSSIRKNTLKKKKKKLLKKWKMCVDIIVSFWF